MKPSRRKRKLARFRARNAWRILYRKIVRTGYFGHFWGATFYVSGEIAEGTAYALTQPRDPL